MDSYSEDLHLQNKGYRSDLSANELSSLERDHEEAQPHFGVDEPLEVQLRFELGSLVDTHVLIDTDGPRESHWDFVRQEQGRFQASSEENNVLLSHGKQDDLKSFGNCASWPGSTSQVDTQLFIDSQDDVNMITEAFGGKDKSMADLVEDDRGLLLPSTYRQCEEGTAWIGEDKEALEAKACKENVVDEAVEASKISITILDSRLAVERSPECRDRHESPVDEHKANREARHPPADVIKEPVLSTEQSCEVKAASLTPCNPQCIGLAVSSDEANRNQELRAECSKGDLVESSQPELSSMDDIEVSEETETLEPTKKVNGPVANAQGFCVSEEKPKMDTVGSTVEAEEKGDDRKLSAMSDSVERESDSDFVSRISLPQETQELGAEPVIQAADLVVDTGVRLDTGKSFIAPGSSCPDNAPGGSCLESESVVADPVEKQNALNTQSTAVNSNIQGDQGISTDSNIQGGQGISTETTTVSRSFQETTVLSILEASTTDENVARKILAYDGELKTLDERNDIARETLDVKWKNSSNLSSIEPADNSLSAVTANAAVPTEVHEECSMPASVVLERGGSYESGAGGMENNNSANSLDEAEVMQGYSSAADLSVVGTRLSHEDISRGQLPAAPETAQMSGSHPDFVVANTKTDPHKDSVEGALDSKHLDEPNNTLSNADSPTKAILEKQVEAHGGCDYFKQEQRANGGNESIPQEQMLKQDTTEKNAIDSSLSSAKPGLSNESKVSTEVSHPGGILHVLLDVHKEGIADDSLLQNAPVQDHVKTIEGVGLADAQASNTSDNTVGGKVAEGQADTYVSDSIGQVLASGSQEDPYPSQGKSGKRKSDSSTRNNRLKDSARASPVQVRSDQEQKNAVSEGLGRRKATPKSTAQKKGTEPVEGFASPRKASSKTSARKKVLSSMVQDAEGSPAAKEGSQTPASVGKTVFSGNARHHVSPDLNGLETASTMVSPSQPFSEPQQVQLRAQILVYGSLIQGAAPEEALMVAAFSNVTGGQVGRDTEASERAVWEKQWQAAVGRIHAKNSRDVPKDSSRANTALVSNSPLTAAKAAEGGSKPNGSSGLANSMTDGRGTTGLPGKALEASGTKGQARPKSTDSAHDVSVSSSQTTVVAASLGSMTPMTLRSVSSSLNESFIQPVKPRADSQQMTPQAYFPTPPLGPFMTGAPQWFSSGSFPGSWMPQTQAAVYSNPPALFTHAQAAVSSDVAPETRRSTPSSSGTVMPVTSLGTTLFTPVVGGMSVTPTAIADPSQNKQPVSESRPRKRKKTHSESHGPSTDVNPSYVTGAIPTVGSPATLTPHMQTGQASTIYLQPSAPEALALVVANTQLPKSSQERSLGAVNANKTLVPSSTNMPSAGLPSVENSLEKSFNFQSSTNHLSQAQASAEEAASVAVSALRESESLWSQLKAQKTAGLIPEIESQLVSSAIAVATAASVAKAAAAAAKAAYQAAVQAKKISEDVLDAGKQANESVPSRLLGDKVDVTSQAWGMPESCNSILAAAKMASKQRLEAVSAARVRAENFESVVRAAELATNAITQVGSVMAMGDSVPFSLDMLLEAGPEGLHRLEDQVKTKPKGTALRSPRRTGTPKSIEREKKFPLKITGGKEVASQRDAQLDNWTSESIMATRPENDARVNAELGVGLLTEFSKQKATDQLALSVPASRQGLLTTRTEGGLMEQEVSVSDNKIVKGSLVEVMSDEKGLRGVWFSARVQSVDDEKVFVLYDDLLADDGYSPLEEWIQLKGSSGKGPRVRLAHPNTNIGFEGTRKRRREAMGSYKWSVGDRVDAWIRDGWWEGEIKEIIEDGESKAKVFFPEDGDTSIVKTSKLRPSLVWSNGHWVLWTDAKQGKKESPRARTDTHEGDTPLAKRQKTEKAQASGSLRQKLVPGSATEASAGHKEVSLFDSSTVNLPPDFKGFTADSIAKSKPQGSKVVFGVPRPTKKRKLIEVSKHFGSAKGITGTSAFDAKAANNKTEGALVYTPGSSDTSRLDASKTKKRVLHHPKARPQKDASSDVKVTGIRSKKEKTVVAAKTLVRKNCSNKEGLLSGSKNKDGKVMKKKNLSSDNDQVESQEQSVDTALPSNVAKLEAHTAPVTGEDIGKEGALATQSKDKPNDAVRESGKEPSQPAQTDGSTVLPKGKEKQSFSQGKDSEIQSLAPASGNESASQSSKKKETQPSKGNEDAGHKGSESHPNHDGGKKLEVSSKKQTAKPFNNVEKQPYHPIKEPEKSKEIGKPAEIWEPRRTSRKIQPTSKLLEGLQTAPKLGKTSSFHDRGNRSGSRAPSQP